MQTIFRGDLTLLHFNANYRVLCGLSYSGTRFVKITCKPMYQYSNNRSIAFQAGNFNYLKLLIVLLHVNSVPQ